MSLLSYIFPVPVGRFSSEYNADIRIVETMGKMRLLVNGSRQSGPYIESLWDRALDYFGIEYLKEIKRILVLGVGGGSVIKLLKKVYPDSMIDAVDIDKKIVDIGKKYFDLDKISNLNFHIADAAGFVADKKLKNRYDLVIVDIFIGRMIPIFADTRVFLQQIRSIMADQGNVLVNYVHDREYEKRIPVFRANLGKIFDQVRETPVDVNSFFMAGKTVKLIPT